MNLQENLFYHKREFVLPTPVAFFAIKRVQVLAKMSKTGDTDYTCVPFVAILDTGVRLYCVSPINSDLSVKYFYLRCNTFTLLIESVLAF